MLKITVTMPWIETKGLWDLPFSGIWHPVGQLKFYNPPDGESFEQLWNIVSVKEIINETESDACIFQVFHCDVEKITEKCRKVFLDVESSMYSLTHQVIFMLLAQKVPLNTNTSINNLNIMMQELLLLLVLTQILYCRINVMKNQPGSRYPH